MSDPLLLAIDTCGGMGGVALGRILDPHDRSRPRSQDRDPGHPEPNIVRVLAARELAGKTYSALLAPKVREMLEEIGVAAGQIAGIVVVNGPGSFTGIRIGASAAKGFAEALDIPVIALSQLELLERAAALDRMVESVRLGAAGICIALDAGRGEFYARVEGREMLLSREHLLEVVSDLKLALFVCEGQVAAALEAGNPQSIAAPTAVDALQSGGERWLARAFDAVETLDGNYLRRSDAELFAKPKERAAAAHSEP